MFSYGLIFVQGNSNSWNTNLLRWASGFIGGNGQPRKPNEINEVNLLPP